MVNYNYTVYVVTIIIMQRLSLVCIIIVLHSIFKKLPVYTNDEWERCMCSWQSEGNKKQWIFERNVMMRAIYLLATCIII